MDGLTEFLSRNFDQLVDRAGAPLHFRLVVMPLVATVLAIRAHMRDVRDGLPTVLWAFAKDPVERRRLLRSGLGSCLVKTQAFQIPGDCRHG